ncbi:hypothetical protein KCU69_g64, partial [Aureobasidium melanogenum]
MTTTQSPSEDGREREIQFRMMISVFIQSFDVISLLLASALLDDPGTLAFFYAISDLKSMTEFEDEVHGKCKVASVPATLTNMQETEVYRKIIAMRNWLEWKFAPAPEMVTLTGADSM